MEHAASASSAGWAGNSSATALAAADHRLAICGSALDRQVALGPCRLLDDRTVAHVRAMADDLAMQLAGAHAAPIAPLRAMLVANRAILLHLHALAVESRLIDVLAGRRALDPVLPPLVLGHGDADATAALLSAQTRLSTALRAMRLPLSELPGDLYQIAWSIRDAACADQGQAGTGMRAVPPDARQTRLALLRRVLAGLGDSIMQALAIDEAGVALFLSALALASGTPREIVALATAEDDPLRLALILRAAGLGRDAAAEQLLAIRPDADAALVDTPDPERLLQETPG
jgi:hypothetical protein